VSGCCDDAIGCRVGGHELVMLAKDDRGQWAWVCRNGAEEHAGFGELTMHGAHRAWGTHVQLFAWCDR